MEHPPTYNALLRGVSHRPIEVKVLVSELNNGANLLIERDPANQFDTNAIKVISLIDEIFLGFVAKEVAAELAPWMDQGWHFTCKVDGRVSAQIVWLCIEPILPEKMDASVGGVVDEDTIG